MVDCIKQGHQVCWSIFATAYREPERAIPRPAVSHEERLNTAIRRTEGSREEPGRFCGKPPLGGRRHRVPLRFFTSSGEPDLPRQIGWSGWNENGAPVDGQIHFG